jgi:hypothetical protein
MKVKTLLLNFFICVVVSIFIDALIWNDPGNSIFIRKFFYLLLMGIPASLIYNLLIYSVYLISANYIAKKVTHLYFTVFILIVISIIYFTIILMLDWYYSKNLYHSFEEYINEFSHYLVFAIICILLIDTSILLRCFKKQMSSHSE